MKMERLPMGGYIVKDGETLLAAFTTMMEAMTFLDEQLDKTRSGSVHEM